MTRATWPRTSLGSISQGHPKANVSTSTATTWHLLSAIAVTLAKSTTRRMSLSRVHDVCTRRTPANLGPNATPPTVWLIGKPMIPTAVGRSVTTASACNGSRPQERSRQRIFGWVAARSRQTPVRWCSLRRTPPTFCSSSNRRTQRQHRTFASRTPRSQQLSRLPSLGQTARPDPAGMAPQADWALLTRSAADGARQRRRRKGSC